MGANESPHGHGDRHGLHAGHDEDHHRGLAGDLGALVERRRAMRLLGGAGFLALIGCTSTTPSASTTAATAASTGGGSSSSGSSSSTARSGVSTTSAAGATTTSGGTSSAECAVIPEETAGPFPGDGSNGPNVLNQSGIVRSDIRSSIGTSTNVAEGVPLTVTLRILELAKGCAPLAGAAVYAWHCDREGGYSMYSDSVANENYLRGVQAASGDGTLTFKTIFPGAYSGRWPHIHFEVYRSLADTAASSKALAVSQLALPEDTCNVVYAVDGYETSMRNMARTTLANDGVFRDGVTQQLAKVTGNLTDGFVATLDVTV